MSDESAKRTQRPNPFNSLPWVLMVMSIPWVFGTFFLIANGVGESVSAATMAVIVAPFVYWGTRDLES